MGPGADVGAIRAAGSGDDLTRDWPRTVRVSCNAGLADPDTYADRVPRVPGRPAGRVESTKPAEQYGGMTVLGLRRIGTSRPA